MSQLVLAVAVGPVMATFLTNLMVVLYQQCQPAAQGFAGMGPRMGTDVVVMSTNAAIGNTVEAHCRPEKCHWAKVCAGGYL